MKKLLYLGFVLCAGVALADETPPIELKHKSSFNMRADERNPFWPIGWKPAPKLAKNEHGAGDSSFSIRRFDNCSRSEKSLHHHQWQDNGRRSAVRIADRQYRSSDHGQGYRRRPRGSCSRRAGNRRCVAPEIISSDAVFKVAFSPTGTPNIWLVDKTL